MKTICAKCAWHTGGTSDVCYAPWPKKIDVVTGKPKPAFILCYRSNDGQCTHFKEKWYRRLLNYLFKSEIK